MITKRTIPCRHWRSNGSSAGGACLSSNGAPGGFPSYGYCLLACKAYDGPESERAEAQSQIADGSVIVPLRVKTQVRPRKKSCGDLVVRWLGLRWLGRPWPLRWTWDRDLCWPVYIPAPGCGCILRLKQLTERIKRWRALQALSAALSA